MSSSARPTNWPELVSALSVHVLPYVDLVRQFGMEPANLPAQVSLSAEQFEILLKLLLRGVYVDETWYRRTYPDVAQAIEAGNYKSAKHHFVENGYFEGRKPGPVVVDEDWYLEVNPDVAEGIQFGEIGSAQEHFETHGQAEGRLPREY